MFCSKCGNQLKDSDRFCAKCGTPVVKESELQEKPTGEPVYSQTPMIGSVEAQPVHRQTAAPVQKKSKKGLIIGLSLGGVLLAVILAAGLIFVFGLKGGSKGNDGSINLGYSTVVYDDQYTYFLSETETWEPCIKRVSNDLRGKPEILYEAEEIKGDGWSQYPMGCIFLWNEKICFIEITKATEQGNDEYEIHWLSKNGKENGTLVSYEQLNTHGDLLSQMEGAYFFNDYLIFGNRFSFYRLDLNTGELCRQEDFLDLEGPACFVAYQNGYYYYFIPDIENNLMGETLYRKTADSEAEEIGSVPSQDDDDAEKYFSFIPKGDYLYYADSENIYRLSINDGEIGKLASYDDSTYNRFALCENGLYYSKDMTLHFLNTETLEETILDKVEGIPDLIYAGADDACWMQSDPTSQRYNCFLPDKQGGLMIYFGESDQDASTDGQETVNTTELYANVIDRTIAEHGALWFDEVEYECCARGVFKIDLMDFNQDGTEELVMLYNNEESIFPFVDVWTVKNGEAVQLFCERQQEENHEAAISSRIYQNGGNLYVPVYDSLDQNPVYVHLYGLDENGEFGEVYQYENNAFYMNQLPDDMEFTEYSSVQFYVCDRVTDYGAQKNLMKESLQTDMEDILKRLELAVPENSSTQTSQSEFDITSMLGEWTLEVAQPNTENVSRHLIRLNADGTMTLRAEDGSWLDYTYTMDETHFYYTYSATGITGGGTYAISGDKIILSKES